MQSDFKEGEKQHIIGWREWLALPDLKIDEIKAKIDTGARTSVLHAFSVNLFEHEGIKKVNFSVHPNQFSTEKVIQCESFLHDMRWVTDSGGRKELRPVIKTNIKIGVYFREIEITLTSRDNMRFRFLLGRSAVPAGVLIDPSSSYQLGKKSTIF